MTFAVLSAVCLVLVLVAWISSFFDKAVRSLPSWRRVVSWTALISLTGSIIELLRCSEVMTQTASAHRFNIIVPFARIGFVLAVAAFSTCWFSTWKTVACLLPSTLIVGLLWFLELLAA